MLESGTAQQRPVSAACPVLHAFVNGVPTQILLDTGSVVSGVSERFLRGNKKYFRTAPSLPINQFYIRTATDTKEKIDTQYYLTIMLEKVQLEVCVVGINNLICDVLLGVDVLEQIRAVINTSEHLLKCTIDNVSYTFKLNTHTHTKPWCPN